MSIARRVAGKYGLIPKGSLRLMSKVVQDRDYKLHGKQTPVYMYFFLQDEEGKNFALKDGNVIVEREELEEWELNLIV